MPETPEHGRELAKPHVPLWSAGRTADALGVSRAVLERQRTAGSLLRVMSSDGEWFCPITQFERRDVAVFVRPALRRFLTTLREFDPWTVGVLMVTPAQELDDLTPSVWTHQGRDERSLAAFADRVRAEWTHGAQKSNSKP